MNPKPPTCPTCQGEGQVKNYYVDKKGNQVVRYETCPHCGGSGRLD